jgi:DNA-binding winged helix-turn-helix (wHTH) protein
MTFQPFDRETAARVLTLPEPVPAVDELPIMGPRGQLTFRNHSVCVSERNALLLSVLLYHYGNGLSDIELLERVWPEGATRHTLRWHLRRLDRRVRRVGLELVDLGDHTHALRPSEC